LKLSRNGSISPEKEERLLLLLSRTSLTPKQKEESLDIIRDGLLWERFLSKVSELEVSPLVYNTLSSLIGEHKYLEDFIPGIYLYELKKSYYLSASRNMVLFREVGKILSSLNRLCIPFIVLKGAYFAELVYPNRALRTMTDVDILVRKEDVKTCEALLRESGYSPCMDSASSDYYADLHHIVPYNSGDGLIRIEVHTHIVKPTFPVVLDIEGLWRRAKRVEIAGNDTLVLSPEDTVLHLCLHFCVHLVNGRSYAGRFRGMCDICEFLAKFKKEINWDVILKESKKHQIAPYIYYPLWFAKEFLDADIPEDVLVRLKGDVPFGSLEDRVLKALIKRFVFLSSDTEGGFIPEGFIYSFSRRVLLGSRGKKGFTGVFFGAVLEVIWAYLRAYFVFASRGIRHLPFREAGN
jgi:hypothetical protein